jgi:hypothetical protein
VFDAEVGGQSLSVDQLLDIVEDMEDDHGPLPKLKEAVRTGQTKHTQRVGQ